jgi:Skp family chaperone for outer membrane proteins
MLTGAVVAAALFVGVAGMAWSENKDAKKPAPAAADKDKKDPAPAAQPAAQAPAPAPGSYKIGIVDRRQVLLGWNKVKAERDKLEAEVEVENKAIEQMANELQSEKDAYDKAKDTLSQTEREEKETVLNKKFMDYQTKLQTKQAEVDDRENRLRKRFAQDIDDAVTKIGNEGSYHIILDGSKISSTLYYNPTLDISTKVIDHLNATSK